MSLRNNIETYAMTPTDQDGGSITVTNGIKITAHAFYNHLLSEFDSVDCESVDAYDSNSEEQHSYN